ncbi:hypothetical protein KIW84_057184 [Lathyrus oleraceus]|uniref:Helitron helicase-like domain-containing protein n=1 Tax=Pisum sativum TaxID=3888 RepID=A0A9D4X2K3_PEA|nr:hypothetical protein KIW84_057184 [Pisum sativum]
MKYEEQFNLVDDMVGDTFEVYVTYDEPQDFDGEQFSNEEAQNCYQLLKEMNMTLYEGSLESKLSICVRLLTVNANLNVPDQCLKFFTKMMLDATPTSFYDERKLVSKLGLEDADCAEIIEKTTDNMLKSMLAAQTQSVIMNASQENIDHYVQSLSACGENDSDSNCAATPSKDVFVAQPNVRHHNKSSNNRRIIDPTCSEGGNENVPWEQATKRNRLTIREWFAFRIHSISNEAQTILRLRRLYQQFLVDGFTMMELEKLRWFIKNQSKLKVGKYHYLTYARSNGHTHGAKTGKRVMLPSSYVGSRRCMDQLYFDEMATCSYVGFLDLFMKFTCNQTGLK